jgi:hypothetical protein
MGNTVDKLQNKTLVLGVGAQRGGPSWLATYFSSHPDIYVSSICSGQLKPDTFFREFS